jgi:glycosyltransferase involved in cell wall biosynthesis
VIENYSITILVPVYNEARLLNSALPFIKNFASNNIADYELLIIESGSTDDSSVICDTFAVENPNVRVIHEGKRNGFGSALKLGYKEATKDWIWLITADIPFPLDALQTAAKHFDDYDCILSYRSHDPRGWVRRFQSFVYNSIIKLVLGLRVKNINSGFRLYKWEFVRQLKLISNGWFIDAELLYWMTRLKCRYIELPVPIIEREGGVSSVGTLAFVGVLREMFFFIRYRRRHL